MRSRSLRCAARVAPRGKKPRESLSAAGSAVRAAGGTVHAGRGDARRLRAAFVSARADVCARAEGGRKKIVRRIRIRKRRYRGLCGKCLVYGRTGICAEETLPARRGMSKKLSEAGEDGRKPLTNALFRGIILQKSSLFIAVFAFFARKRKKEGAFLR